MNAEQIIGNLLELYRKNNGYGIMVGQGQIIEDLLADLELYCREQNLDFDFLANNAKLL